MSVATPCEQSEQRSQVYWLLSRFYLEPPNSAFLDEMRGALQAEAEHDGPGGELDVPALYQAMQALRLALEGGEGGDRQLGLEREYTRLFRGIKQGYGPPPPYESVYRQSRLMGEITLAVLDQYRQAGFVTVETSVGPQDHIGAELKFMALLCFREAESGGEGEAANRAKEWRGRQTAFLDRHLLQWVPDYCAGIEEQSREPLYRALASLTRHVVGADREYLQRPAVVASAGVRPIPRPSARDAVSP